MELKDTQAALEAILFASGEPVGVERLCLTLELDRETVDELCSHLADQYSYERRGLRVLRLDNAWQMASAPEYADLIRQTFESRKPAKLSQPALEVLSIIAYFQPTTRAYVDQVRGVDSSYTVGLLLERELIEECGRLAVPGRPILYRTTKNFLRSFSLSSLDELPELPNSTAEDGQLTLEIQANIEKLRAQQELADISDDELLEAAAKLAEYGFTSYRAVGDGETVTDQTPPAGRIVPLGAEIILYMGAENPASPARCPTWWDSPPQTPTGGWRTRG